MGRRCNSLTNLRRSPLISRGPALSRFSELSPRLLVLALASATGVADCRRHGLASQPSRVGVGRGGARLPPVYIVPALIPAFTGLLWLLERARHWRTALLVGFLFGLGYFTAGLYWVANALLTRPEEFGWLAPLAPIGLAAILAPFPAIACALTMLVPRSGASRVLGFAAAWTLLEWVRSWAFTGFLGTLSAACGRFPMRCCSPRRGSASTASG